MIVRPGPDRGRLDAARDRLLAIPSRALARAGVRRARLYERRLTEGAGLAPGSALEHRWLDRDDVIRLAGATGQDPGKLVRQLERGERCFGTLDDGRLVAARWIAQGRAEAPFLRIGVRLPEADAWVFDSWTDPRVRGRGLAADGSAALGRALSAEGVRRLVAIVWTGNRSGNGAVRRAGYRELGTITAVLGPGRPVVRFRARRQPYS